MATAASEEIDDVAPVSTGSGMVAPRSVVQETLVQPVEPSATDALIHRPRTRLQDNIRKPKQYTDGIICYGYGILCSTGKSASLDEALKDAR